METINTYYNDYAGLAHFVDNNKEILLSSEGRSVLVQLFSGVYDEDYLLTISQQVRELIPHAQIIGATTNGEIMNGLVSGLKTVLSFSVFFHSDIKVVFSEKRSEDEFELGQSIASRISSDKAKILILFATGLNLNASRLLKGIQTVNPHLPVAGGNAGNNLTNTQRLVCCNDNTCDCGVVGAVIESDSLSVNCYSHLGWQPIGKEMTITSAEGSRVYTIDNIPAYQIYHQYLGFKTMSNIFNVVEFPLTINRHGIIITRAPLLRCDDDSIVFAGDIAEGERVRFSFGHVKMILEKTECLLQKIRQETVESIFVYSCASRRGFLQELSQSETLPLQNIAPTAGFFTSGEFFHTDSSNLLLNTTMTTLTLSESIKQKAVPGAETKRDLSLNEIVSTKDNMADRTIEILRALTCLVDKVTSELNERTVELQIMNEQIQYTANHDALTGLYNRNFFNQELKRMEGKSAGIIICDLDGLKIVNDSFGHSKGDALLQAAANIFISLLGPDDIAARIGGDEFSILLPNHSRNHIEDLCAKIRIAVEEYNHYNPMLPLSISIGFACLEDDGTIDISDLFKEADNRMYREKLKRKQNTNSALAQSMLANLEKKDIITLEHGNRIQELFIKLSLDREFPQCDLKNFFLFTRFHDIGKIGVSDEILSKANTLTHDEKIEMQKHCEIGYRIARSLHELHPIADWILKHHEWWNGEGYPLGIKGDDIPLECRILAILDAYDDMTNDRPYRKATSRTEAIKEISQCAGTQFDPLLAEMFICRIKTIDSEQNKGRFSV